ncbi:hypothetical protein KKG90_01390 [Candidatus Bipolaricaulota bacterium]|nr:hypothetical protein [Candidatus Bipolaricaulota bacterium]
MVRDGLAVLVAVVALSWPCSAIPTISGEWESALSLEPATSIWSTQSDVTVEMSLQDWTVSARSIFEDGAWEKQQFDVETDIGSLHIESDVRFEPDKDRFQDWITQIEWAEAAWMLALTTKLTRTTDWMILELEREWTLIETATFVRFRAPTGSCTFVFYDASLELAFDHCGMNANLEIAFDDDGFDETVLELSDLILTKMPWITFDLELTRTVETKAIKLVPSAQLEGPWCKACLELEFEGDFPDSPSLVPLAITEANLTWEMGAVDVEAAAILEPSEWIANIYWLKLQIDAGFELASCGNGSIDLVLLWTQARLGELRFAFDYEPCRPFSVIFEGDLDLVNGQLDRLAVSAVIEW